MSRAVEDMMQDLSIISVSSEGEEHTAIAPSAPPSYAAAAAQHAQSMQAEQNLATEMTGRAKSYDQEAVGQEKRTGSRFAPPHRAMQSEQRGESRNLCSTIYNKVTEYGASAKTAEAERRERSKANAAKLPASIEELQGMVRGYQQALEEKQKECDRLRQERNSSKQFAADTSENCNRNIEQLWQHFEVNIKAEKQDTVEAQRKKHEAEQTCKEWEQKAHQLENTVHALQTAALRSVESAKWAPLDHSEVKLQLDDLVSDLREWSSENMTHSWEKMQDPDTWQTWTRFLKSSGCLQSSSALLEAMGRNEVMQLKGKAHALLVTALVTVPAISKIVGDPFFAFTEETGRFAESNGKYMGALLNYLIENDESGAEALRCQLLRLLNPLMNEHSRTVGIRAWSYRLLRTNNEELLDPFTEILEEAVDLAWNFWTRKQRIEVLDLPALAKQLGDQTPLTYAAKSEFFEAHALHSGDLAKNPNALDGQDILLLCSPAVIAVGSADGGDYEKRKVLKKAVVWMG